jgi:hypothetical protein
VDEGLATLESLRHGLGIRDVAHDEVVDLDAPRLEDPTHLGGIADEEPHLVSGGANRGRRMGADETGTTGDEHSHGRRFYPSPGVLRVSCPANPHREGRPWAT